MTTMNNRIKELVDQAKKSVPHGLKPEKWLEVYHEKFAELIVKESITALKTNTKGYDNRAMFLMTEMINRSESILLEHFGVKE